MSEEMSRVAETLGEIKGGLASLTKTVHGYIDAHDGRHERIDASIKEHEAEINQAKGAKGAVIVMATGVSAIVGTIIAVAGKFFK